MGSEGDAKWHRALLKKLRSAVAVKSRVDAGDTKRLQKSQAGKGTKRAIDEALGALKNAGLGRDSPLVRAAFEQGAKEGAVAMEAAAKRGPDGGTDGTTPSKKRLKREARAEAWAAGSSGGGVEKSGGLTKGHDRNNAATTPNDTKHNIRNPHVSGHVFAACKRAVFQLHALAKEDEQTSKLETYAYCDRFEQAVRTLCEPENNKKKHASLVAAADAQLTGVGLWALAKTSRRTHAFTHEGKDYRKLVTDCSRALVDRFKDQASLADARGAATVAWSVASLATSSPALLDRTNAVTTAGRALRRLSVLSQSSDTDMSPNPQDASNAMWACAKLRVVVDATTLKRLVAVVAESNKTSKLSSAKEKSSMLWALATLHSDGLCPDAPAIAGELAKITGECVGKYGSQCMVIFTSPYSPRVVGDAAWACGKLIAGCTVVQTLADTYRSAITSFACAAAEHIARGTSAFPPRNLANTLWACAAARVDREKAEPLAVAFFATATASGRAESERRRKGMLKASGGDWKGVKSSANKDTTHTETSPVDFDFENEQCSFETAKPTPDDIAVAVESTALLELKTVDADKIRSAISSALTQPADKTHPGINWRATGRLEHAAFAALNCGAARSTIETGVDGVTKQDAEVLKRLLRRGAAAATEADAQRLTLEEGSSELVTDFLVKENGAAVLSDTTSKKVLCVDDTHRLLSLPLREKCGWKVTNWNRFGRRDRVGAVWPSTVKELFDHATVRYPPTRSAAEMALTAVAARLKPNAPVYIYGAAVEGIFNTTGSDRSSTGGNSAKPVIPRHLFSNPHLVSTSKCGKFAVVVCERSETEIDETKIKQGASAFRKVGTLTFPKSSDSSSKASSGTTTTSTTTTIPDWRIYPGLFAGGGLDVMTAALLKAMPSKFEKSEKDDTFAVLDYCSGSGVLAAALGERVRSDATLTLSDADSVALLCAKENFAQMKRPAVIVNSDCFGGLGADEKFDLIVSNPPVHLGLQPEFTVFRALLTEAVDRMKRNGRCYLVAQRYVPVAAMAFDADVDVQCVFADDKFAVWMIVNEELPKGNEAKKEKKVKKEKKKKKGKADKKEKKSKKEKK